MEKDKKYNLVLGLMIFFFILFVGICVAWGLGYIHLGKQNSSDEIAKEEVSVPNTDNENTSNTDNTDNTDNSNNTNNNNPNQSTTNNTNTLKNAYKKYDFEWVSKKKNTITYVETDTVRVVIDNKVYDVSFDYGTPKYSCPLPGHDFHGLTVINDKGEAYIGKFENGNFDSMKYTKVNISEKIVDTCFSGDDASTPYSGPYYMTETGKVVDRNGNSYEEINKNHISYVGDALSIIYICDDYTLDIPLDNNDLTSYAKVVDSNKNNIKAKQIFYDSYNSIYYIVTENNALFKVDNMETGIATAVNSKTVKSISYTSSEYHMVVNFTDNTKTIYSEVYSSYDLENDRHMQ